MRCVDLFETEIDDMRAEIARTKEQFARLQADRSDLQRRRISAPDDKWERMRRFGQGITRLHTQRHIELADKLQQLKARVRAEKTKGTAMGMFINYSSQKTPEREYLHHLGKLIDEADAALPDPAATAIEYFVGHPYSKSPEDGAFGIMHEYRLEDAFSDQPSERGGEIRQQLAQAFAPIRDALRQEFGDQITIYRAQERLRGNEKPRNALSWTGNLRFAEYIGNNRDILTKSVPIDDLIWITDRANQAEFIVRSRN